MRILAVDDDPFVLELLGDALEISGFDKVVLRSNPEDAYGLLEAGEPFDCILLDIQMPGLDGIELCRRLRELEAHAETPVLMVTAMLDKQYINAAFAAGANDYITKPFDVMEVGLRVSRAIEIHQAEKMRALLEAEAYEAELDLHDQISLFEVSRLADKPTIVNYFRQIARSGAPHSCVAIGIRNLDAFQALGRAATEEVIRQFARTIEERMGDENYLCSYVAPGTCICLIQGRERSFDVLSRVVIEDALEYKTRGTAAASVRPEIAASRPVRGRVFGQFDPETAIETVIAELSEDAGVVTPPAAARPSRSSAA